MLKSFKENTVHGVGFILHMADFHKPSGAFIMKYGEKFFWVWIMLFAVSVVSNFFIA